MARLRIVSGSSRAAVAGDAPGHRFRAEGTGVEGLVVHDTGRLIELDVTFPLASLDAGDLLKNRELRRFLDLEQRPIARAELTRPVDLRLDDGSERFSAEAPLLFSIGARRMPTTALLTGALPRGTARFTITFSGLGYAPPKLLFIKMKDMLDVEVTVELASADAVG